MPADARRWVALAAVAVSASASAALAVTPAERSTPPETRAVLIADYGTRKPLAQLAVEITSEVVAPCIKAPCPTFDHQRWQGTTDKDGVLRYPTSLDKPGAVVYAHAVGSQFASDVHGDGAKDARGRPIVLLRRPDRMPVNTG